MLAFVNLMFLMTSIKFGLSLRNIKAGPFGICRSFNSPRRINRDDSKVVTSETELLPSF
jgi:hypothetical protein